MEKKEAVLRSLKRPSMMLKLAGSKRNKRMFYAFSTFFCLQIYSQSCYSKIKLYHQNTFQNREIIQSTKALKRGFYKNSFFLPTSLSQISNFGILVYGNKIARPPLVQYQEELFKFKDGG
jgi:hypothetical protein